MSGSLVFNLISDSSRDSVIVLGLYLFGVFVTRNTFFRAISGFLKHVMDYNLLYLQILYRICFDYVNDRICSEYSNDQSRALDPQKNQPVLRRAL
jgi:hypothetical protein